MCPIIEKFLVVKAGSEGLSKYVILFTSFLQSDGSWF